jgi:hypothetical protein
MQVGDSEVEGNRHHSRTAGYNGGRRERCPVGDIAMTKTTFNLNCETLAVDFRSKSRDILKSL